MFQKNISSYVDHTNLSNTATEQDIKNHCKVAKENNVFSVCVPPYFVPLAKKELKNSPDIAVCTVIGFPNGYSTTHAKAIEAIDAILDGADEIDMVVNINMIKDGKWSEIKDEISYIAEVCHCGFDPDISVTLKVIVETCLLTNEEKLKMCDICIDAKADFIKTSTGFDKSGADIEDIKAIKEYIGDRNLLIKASGGIKTLEKAQKMINAGADRIGASSLFEKQHKQQLDTAFDDFIK